MSALRLKTKPYAVIIGLDSIQGLQTARILAKWDVPVIGIAQDINNSYCLTRSCKRVLSADIGGAELTEVLDELGPDLGKYSVLYPCSDLSVLEISRNREMLSQWYRIMLPDVSLIETMMDKNKFYDYAQSKGLLIPHTCWLNTRADAERVAAEISFPYILKPDIKTPAWQKNVGQKVIKVNTVAELLAAYDLGSPHVETMVLQQWIEGGDSDLYTCNCYFDSSTKPVAVVVSKKIRQWPPSVGMGCLSEEFKNDIVKERTLQIFEQVPYCGLAYAEFKYDRNRDQYYLIEVNVGRPTGRSPIAEAAGVELHYAMYCDAVGYPMPAKLEQIHNGVKWIHLVPDLRSAWQAYHQEQLTLAEWIKSVRGSRVYASFSWSDPLPFFGQFIGDVSSLLRSLKRD